MKNKLKSFNDFFKKGKYGKEILVVTFIVVLTLIGFLMYNSLAIFQGSLEKKDAAKIVAGQITFDITSTDSNYNSSTKQITVEPYQEIELPLSIKNTTPIKAKYKLYYKPINPSSLQEGTLIAVLGENEEKAKGTYDNGVLETSKKVDKTIIIRNTSSESITIEVGVDGGYSYNSIELESGHNQLGFEEIVSPNPPILSEGMIPVVYDNSTDNWEVADTNDEWYNYDKQWWANAVTVSDAEYRNKPAGTEIPMEVINSMWVWIPRYKYQILNNIGSTSNVTKAPQISVIFEKGTETTGNSLDECPIDATNCYYTHPAFRNGSTETLLTSEQQESGGHTGWDKEITGIWVGKFETGGSTDTPLIKPDIISLTNQNVSSLFTTSLKFSGGTINSDTGEVTFAGNTTYGLTKDVDTHMIKNTEWGAVTYLSQSKYGKNGNANYNVEDKEVYINNSSSYYTGRSGGTPNQGKETYGTYSYNGKNNCTSNGCAGEKTEESIIKGMGASTTGTIYGIYDMSGGANEYIMGNFSGFKGSYSDTNTIGISLPNKKYYDEYTGKDDSNTITKDKSIKGDAEYETMRWYSDYANFAHSINPWLVRGALYDNEAAAGVFYTSYATGSSNSTIASRTVLIP